MKFLKSHNDYRCSTANQITKAKKLFDNTKKSKALYSKGNSYDELIVEADVICVNNKIILAHEESLNPLKILGVIGWSGKWRGFLDDYVAKASKLGLKYVMIELKDTSSDCRTRVQKIINAYPKITFVCLSSKSIPTGNNVISNAIFEAHNTVVQVDLY